MTKKLTQNEFVERFNFKHPNATFKLIDEYKGGLYPTKFKCEKHGEFIARPRDILNGQGCPKCGGTKHLTEQEFIEKATLKHNGFFTYNSCNFINVNEKVNITCPIHGDFLQKANNHLQGQGCPQCKKEHIKHPIQEINQINKSTKKLTIEEVKTKITDLYGNKYDLSLVDYKNSRTKVKIICKEHGIFEITPNHLLLGRGCPYCANNVKFTIDDFINKAQEKHGNTYQYHKSIYRGIHMPLTITCKEHGDFIQIPSNHLKGQGCPLCKSSSLENDIRKFLQENGIHFEEQKHFEWLGKLSLDFYLPQYNIAIECQGEQHFKPILFFNKKTSFDLMMQRDERKRQLCKENNVKLLYYSNLNITFPYHVYTNTDELLKEILQ